MQDLVKDFMSQKKFAVVGSFKNKDKFAYQILLSLLEKNRIVYPVNPNLKIVEGINCYPAIQDLPEKVDVVNLVTPAKVTEEIVKQCLNKGITRVWMQPGAESKNAIKFCDENNIKVVYNACMILQR